MPQPAPVVFLLDVDNTLLDNDHVAADLRKHLTEAFGAERQERYWAIFEELRGELGYADYLGALQRYRAENPRDPHLLEISFYLVDYPFANRLYPESLDVLAHLSAWGPTVILSDGDVVFQPRKVQRSGLFDAVDGRVLIYIHKEHELADVEERYPGAALRAGGRQAAHPRRGEEGLGQPPHHGVSAAGALRPRSRSHREVSAGRHRGRAHRRLAAVRFGGHGETLIVYVQRPLAVGKASRPFPRRAGAET